MISNKYKRLNHSYIVKYTLQSFEQVRQKPQMKDLIVFHTKNKHLLMAFSQAELKILGKTIANRRKTKACETCSLYEKHLRIALRKLPTRSSHVNVLRKLVRHFYTHLSSFEVQKIEELITVYQKGYISLGSVLGILELIAYRFDKMYLYKQTYFLLFSDRKC